MTVGFRKLAPVSRETGHPRYYYSSKQPTRPAHTLPMPLQAAISDVTPCKLIELFTELLYIDRKSEVFEGHPAIRLLQGFPKQKKSILARENAPYFRDARVNWDEVPVVKEPQSIVMCPPTHYFNGEITYMINVWMKKGLSVSGDLAMMQWGKLQAEVSSVMPVDVMPAKKNCPDMTFVDQGLAVPGIGEDAPNIFIPSVMSECVRRGEVNTATAFFRSRGYKIEKLPKRMGRSDVCTFESNGDVHVVPGRQLLFAGCGGRTSRDVLPVLAEITEHYVIPLQLKVDKGNYHLDTATSVVSEDTAIVYPEGLRPRSLALFFLFFANVYLVNDAEAAADFIPNSKQIRDTMFTQTSVNEGFLRFLDDRPDEGVRRIVQVDMSEFNKSGGGINCCSKLAFHVPPQE